MGEIIEAHNNEVTKMFTKFQNLSVSPENNVSFEIIEKNGILGDCEISLDLLNYLLSSADAVQVLRCIQAAAAAAE